MSVKSEMGMSLVWKAIGDERLSCLSTRGFFGGSTPSPGSTLIFSKDLFSLSFLVLSELLDLLLLLVMEDDDDDDDELEEDLESCLVIFGNDTLLTSGSFSDVL